MIDCLSDVIGALSDDLTTQQARTVVNARPPVEVIARAQELAERANSGCLTDLECVEYEGAANVLDCIEKLRAKACFVPAGAVE